MSNQCRSGFVAAALMTATTTQSAIIIFVKLKTHRIDICTWELPSYCLVDFRVLENII